MKCRLFSVDHGLVENKFEPIKILCSLSLFSLSSSSVMSSSERNNPKCSHFGCDKRLKDMGLLHVKLPVWRAHQEAAASKSSKVYKARLGVDVPMDGEKRKKWLGDWLEYSGHSGCDEDHTLMKQRRPKVACLSHMLCEQYYGTEDGDDVDSKKTFHLYANELPEAGHAPLPPPDLSESSLRLAPKIRGIEGSLPFSLPLFPFSFPPSLLFISASRALHAVYIHTSGALKRKAGELTAADVQVKTLFSAHCGLASELQKRQKEVEDKDKELKGIRNSFRASEVKRKKMEKELENKEKVLEEKEQELEETQTELESYEKHIMEYGGAGAPAASPVVLRPASAINPPDLFVSPPESGLLRKAAPASSEVSYVLKMFGVT